MKRRNDARTIALDALVRAKAFLDRIDRAKTPAEHDALVREMRDVGFYNAVTP